MFELFRAIRLEARADELLRRKHYAEAMSLYAEALGIFCSPAVDLEKPWAYEATIGALRNYVRAALALGDETSARAMLDRWDAFLEREPPTDNVDIELFREELLEIDRSLCRPTEAPQAPA